MNQNLGNVGFFSNITIIYLLTIRILPKRTFCCWLINDVNVLLTIQSWLKDFCCLTNDDRKTNAKWTGSSSGETLFQRFKPFNHVSCFLVEVDFLCVRSSHMVPKRTFPQNCCAKAELATLELQKQSLFGPCKSFEKFGGLN